MAIAAGIGLHNFSEGLAIGQAASGGELTLAVLLIVAFALCNTTEGFGIVGPLAAAEVRAPPGLARPGWPDRGDRPCSAPSSGAP
jgi:ZIP family zinc transporter